MLITTVEMHTAGEPFRIVTGGLPALPGARIVQRRAWLRDHADQWRRALILEPRGHADMYAGFLTAPVSDTADFGVIFAHNEGYSDHCGHGVIALATAAVQLGWVSRQVPETRVGVDAPCGFIEAFVEWDGARTGQTRFLNVPSFLLLRDVVLRTERFGDVTGDVAYGGAFYVYTPAPAGLDIAERHVAALVEFATEVTRAAKRTVTVAHPEIAEINRIYGTIVDGAPRHPGSSQANCCVFAEREVDRSPTGSGTAGRVAQLYARGVLPLGQRLVNESIIGSVFSGHAVCPTRVGDHDAVIVEICGRAHLCGTANWVIDPQDGLGRGFLVR